jgi:hypothetical protein
MRPLLSFLVAAALSTSASGQMPAEMMAKMAADPVAQTTRIMFEQHAGNMISAAELMPADKYTFIRRKPR